MSKQQPVKGRIKVIDGETSLRMDYDEFVQASNVAVSNDYNRDMPTALLKAVPDPHHGYRVYLGFEGDEDQYFACYEWDATIRRWRLEATSYEPRLPTLREAYKALVDRIEFAVKTIDENRIANTHSYNELKKIVDKLVEKEGKDVEGLEAFERMSRIHETAYFKPE